jgi:hypothetical protein
MPATQTAPTATIGSMISIGADQFKISAVDSVSTPLVFADLVASGFDACHYIADRVLIGRQRVKRTALLTRVSATGEMRVVAMA